MSKKLPYEKFIYYLLLSRNKLTSISDYITCYKLGELDGRNIRRYDNVVRKLATPKQLGILDSIYEPAQEEKDVIHINLKIHDELKDIAEQLEIKSDLFQNTAVKFICENLTLRRSVEVYLTTRMQAKDIVGLINDKFRLKFHVNDIEEYRYWFYDLSNIAPDDLDSYFYSLPKEEQQYKLMAYLNKEDYVKWKMKDECNIDKNAAIQKIMEDAFYNWQETLNAEVIAHSAAKTWADIFFKAIDYLEKSEGISGTEIFTQFRFNIIKDSDKKIFSFSELMEKDKNEK